MYLMCKDEPILQFDLEEYTFTVLNNQLLPYSLKDYLCSSDDCISPKEIARFRDAIKTFFADRVLTLSRSNAKQILMAATLPQKLTDEDRCKIALMCRGVSVTDSYWVKSEDEEITFQKINVRSHSLSDTVFQVSIEGKPLSLQLKDLEADLTTQGMFLKTWMRIDDNLFLAKTDKLKEHDNVKSEVIVSSCLDKSNVRHVQYQQRIINGYVMSLCECMTTDDVSLVDAEYVRQWCNHTGRDFMPFIKSFCKEDFAKMVVCDYVFANTDRHINNWGFLVDSNTNEFISMAPLFDHNQCLIADTFGTDVDSLVYEPTGTTFREAVDEWAPYAGVVFENDTLDGNPLLDKARERFLSLDKIKLLSEF